MSTNFQVPRIQSRKTLQARGGISFQTIHAPGVGGMITDVPSWQLKTVPYCQVPNMQDIVFPNGIPSVRGAPALQTNLGTISTDSPPFYVLVDVQQGNFNFFWSGQSLHANISGSNYTASQNASTIGPNGSNAYRPLCKWGNEIVWAVQPGFPGGWGYTGVYPLIRTGITAWPASAVGNTDTRTFTANSNQVSSNATGGTLPNANNAVYIQYNPLATGVNNVAIPYTQKLTSGDGSGAHAALEGPVPVSSAGSQGGYQNWGMFGLSVTVKDKGLVSAAAGTLTGIGTNFLGADGATPGVEPGDIITIPGNNPGLWAYVTSVTNQTSLSYVGNLTGVSNSAYTIRRPMCGTYACVYGSRLWMTGVGWYQRRVFYTPLTSSVETFTSPATQGPISPYHLSDITNGYFSGVNNPGDANEMPWLDVPDNNTAGAVVGLAPTASGLLVLATDGAYMVHGDPPTTSTRFLAPGADCIDPASITVAHNAVYWAGQGGIFECTGGRVLDLTEKGGRAAEWAELMETAIANGLSVNQGGVQINSWVANNHLAIAVWYHNAPSQIIWVWDLHRQVWCGNHTITPVPTIWSASTSADTDEAYVLMAPNRNSSVNLSLYSMHECYEDDGAGDPNATPIIDLPLSVCGIDISELRRVVENKVTYEQSGGGSDMEVWSGMDGSALGRDSFLPATTSTGPQTFRILPNTLGTGSLGLQGNAYSIRIWKSGTSTTWRVHMVNLAVRTWPQRIT